MPHTLPVRGIVRSIAIAFVCGALSAASVPSPVLTWQAAVDQAARASPASRILVLDIATGRLIASHHLSETARTLAAPGSTLKPLVLYSLVAADRWNPDRRVACDRKLVVAGHRLACTHPPAPPFDAREALAWSCNNYFAQVASSVAPGTLGPLLRPTGLLSMTGLAGKATQTEATAEFREPTNSESLQLVLLGVQGIRVTPLELAVAYRWLALQLAAHPDSQASRVVSAAIENSASFGMARQASQGGVPVAGKTGTAEGGVSTQSHGWFAGMAPAETPQVVLVVYLPAGRGADAAGVAAQLLANSPLRKP
ncbi:MAG TPA: penicillin-binding transpeptidase domain-containing protein [Terracidiphilus sp.]|nr:penicillin-binding transpeptidase domain-containing protein [Terracidiphilus sp.]